jgi:predicted RNA-binding Zn ribbon-like protein
MIRYPEPGRPQIVNGQWAGPFIYIAGRLCIDFTQTGGESPPVRAHYETFHQPADFAAWLADCPLNVPGVTVTPDEFAQALALREAIWRSAQAIRQSLEADPADLALINHAASLPDLAPEISGDGQSMDWRGPLTGSAALSTIARDAIDLFTGDLRTRIRECEGPNCALLFVDASRPGLRRWCHMDRCGNRYKTAAYRKRKKSDQ